MSLTPFEKIQQLKTEQAELEKKIRDCKHEFMVPFFDPIEELEADGYKLVGHGSDPYPEATGFHKIQKSRWTRICKHCGKHEYTEKQKPIIIGETPDFK